MLLPGCRPLNQGSVTVYKTILLIMFLYNQSEKSNVEGHQALRNTSRHSVMRQPLCGRQVLSAFWRDGLRGTASPAHGRWPSNIHGFSFILPPASRCNYVSHKVKEQIRPLTNLYSLNSCKDSLNVASLLSIFLAFNF